jgi:hypothetical protein
MGQRAPGFHIQRRGEMKQPTKAVLYRALELLASDAGQEVDMFIKLAQAEIEEEEE